MKRKHLLQHGRDNFHAPAREVAQGFGTNQAD